MKKVYNTHWFKTVTGILFAFFAMVFISTAIDFSKDFDSQADIVDEAIKSHTVGLDNALGPLMDPA